MILKEDELIRDFRIISKIGEGGMGEVYSAEDINLGRKVAVKILAPELARDKSLIDRFRQEARLQASLIHPNIVLLYSFFEHEQNYIIVLEYAAGITLKELINKTGPIPEERSINIIKQVLEGTGFAHSNVIIHRDIKPANIMIGDGDKVKIMDFGIAKILGDRGLTRTGSKMGTIYYMSPEQINSPKDVDHRTDIYSIGITFYQMLTGKLPFDTSTDSDFQVMKEIVEGDFKDPRDIYPYITANTVEVLNTMVSKEKNKRLNSCKQHINNLNNEREKTGESEISLSEKHSSSLLSKDTSYDVNTKTVEIDENKKKSEESKFLNLRDVLQNIFALIVFILMIFGLGAFLINLLS